ncbi:hypothetical protein BGZ94_009966 [Podila epigama]|nr:hypothetical protein BGZ94_009966 [Podila epigama]
MLTTVTSLVTLLLFTSPGVLAQNPVDPKGGPGSFGQARSAFNEEKMFIGDALYTWSNSTEFLRNIFYSLDLTQPWQTTAPAWSQLVYQGGLSNKTARPLGLNKAGSAVYCFDTTRAQAYVISKAKWDRPFNLTMNFDQLGDPITDTDNDIFFHLSPAPSKGGKTLELLKFDTKTNLGASVPGDMTPLEPPSKPGQAPITLNPATFPRGVYSSARKSMYFVNMDEPTIKLHEFNVETNTWVPLVEKGDIPQRRTGACYAAAYGGTKLVLAGGSRFDTPSSSKKPKITTTSGYPTGYPTTTSAPATPTNANDDSNTVLSDVYLFDVETATWTKMTNLPVGFYGAVCAVSGDSLILYGGYKQYSGRPNQSAHNDNVPYILNLKSNAWVTAFIPSFLTTPGTPNPGNGGTDNSDAPGSGATRGQSSSIIVASAMLATVVALVLEHLM